MIGAAVGVHQPEEPLAFLGIGQRDRVEAGLHLGDRQVCRGDALFEHLLQVQFAFVQRQSDKALGNPQSNTRVH
ncbi:hypothetical protein D3C73_1446910 [compost metagenome]